MRKTLLILAAGMSSRYGGGKQVEAMGPHGEILMEYSIHDARQAGFNKIVFVIKRSMEESFRELIESRIGGDVEICYACQEYDSLPGGFVLPGGRVKPYGTAHAVLAAKDIIQEPFAVINADDFYGSSAYMAASACLDCLADSERKAAMVAYRLRNTVSENGHVTRGLCEVNADGLLTRVIETYKIMPFADGTIRSIDGCEEGRILEPEAAISMNFWCFTPSMMQQLECELNAFLQNDDHAHSLTAELTLPDVVDDLVKRGELSVEMLRTEAVWFGVTYREDKPSVMAELEKLHAAQQYPEKLNQ
jgi:dTDP-glucose pyrophosphorylase